MRKTIKYTIIGSICILIITLSVVLAVVSRKPAIPVVLLAPLDTSMGPQQFMKQLGQPDRITKSESFDEVVYEYSTMLDGEPVILKATFTRDRDLYSIYVSADTDTKNAADQLFDVWKSKVAKLFCDNQGYYMHEEEGAAQIGINGNSSGAACYITAEGTVVRMITYYMY